MRYEIWWGLAQWITRDLPNTTPMNYTKSWGSSWHGINFTIQSGPGLLSITNKKNCIFFVPQVVDITANLYLCGISFKLVSNKKKKGDFNPDGNILIIFTKQSIASILQTWVRPFKYWTQNIQKDGFSEKYKWKFQNSNFPQLQLKIVVR